MTNLFRLRTTSLLRKTLLLSLCLLCLSFPAIAQEPSVSNNAPSATAVNTRRRQPRRVDLGRALVRRLNLTPEQVTQLREIRQQSTLERRTIAARLRQAERALDAAIFADGTDEPLIEQRVQRVAEVQREIVRLRASTELKIRRLLTAQQLQALREMRERKRMRRANGHRRGGINSPVEPQTQN